MLTQPNIVNMVCDTTMYILHDSYLYGSNLWPKNGFKVGSGIGTKIKDCIYVGVNAYGHDQNPIIGALRFNIWNTGARRFWKQHHHIKLIMDFAYKNELLFEDQFRTSSLDCLSFKFTYTPNQLIS
jgi:hypothetical protein